MKQSTVYTKQQVKNLLEFDRFNNVIVYEVHYLNKSEKFIPSIFYSKKLADEWLTDICKERNLNKKDYIIIPQTLRFY